MQFTTHVFEAAQALAAYRHALVLRDETFVLGARTRLRGTVATLAAAFSLLPPPDRPEARALAAHLRRRIRDTEDLGEVEPLFRFLDA
jgi:hypothetical protein